MLLNLTGLSFESLMKGHRSKEYRKEYSIELISCCSNTVRRQRKNDFRKS